MDFVSLTVIIGLTVLVLFAVLFSAFEIYAVVIGHLKGAPYVRSPKKYVKTMIELAEIKPGELIIDLGSGDGTIVIEAARKGARAVGIEINPFLVLWSRYRIKKLGLKEQAQIVKGNFFKYSLVDADVILFYLLPKIMNRLKEKFSRELKPGTRIISYAFPIPGWTPRSQKNGVFMYHYRGETSIV